MNRISNSGRSRSKTADFSKRFEKNILSCCSKSLVFPPHSFHLRFCSYNSLSNKWSSHLSPILWKHGHFLIGLRVTRSPEFSSVFILRLVLTLNWSLRFRKLRQVIWRMPKQLIKCARRPRHLVEYMTFIVKDESCIEAQMMWFGVCFVWMQLKSLWRHTPLQGFKTRLSKDCCQHKTKMVIRLNKLFLLCIWLKCAKCCFEVLLLSAI